MSEWAVYGPGYYSTETEASTPVRGGIYTLSARLRAFGVANAFGPNDFGGMQPEYSLGLVREFYHVLIAGRLATAPPQTQGAGYHMVQGETRMTFYGLRLGPEHLALSRRTWEDEGNVPVFDEYDRMWTTRFKAVYSNTDFHLRQPNGSFTMIEQMSQFERKETYHERTSLALHTGFDIYGPSLPPGSERIYKNNIDFPGGAFALRGWPQNYAGASFEQKLSEDWLLVLSGSRINFIGQSLEIVYGGELQWFWRDIIQLRAGEFAARPRGGTTSAATGVGLSASW